jgi:hypothetical protein
MPHSGVVGWVVRGKRTRWKYQPNGTTWTAVSDATVKVDDVELSRIKRRSLRRRQQRLRDGDNREAGTG